MNSTVGVAELRQNLSKYLRRIENGERLIVTDRNKPVAMLGPPPTTGPKLDRMIAAGLVEAPKSSTWPEPMPGDGTSSFSDALIADREDRVP